jgi:hypothetical protein
MISRDWHCLNVECGRVFHSFEKSQPPCPSCGCLRTDWVPGGGHIMAVAPRLDARIRSIADQHGMTNLNSPSPSRLDRAAPRVESPPLSPELGVKHWGMGIYSQMSQHGPVCIEASNPVHLTGKLPVGNFATPRTASGSIPGPAANAVVEYRSSQRTIPP